MRQCDKPSVVALAILLGPWLLAAETRFSPDMDDPAREWCYLSKSTTVIGVPFARRPIQVTFDGAVFAMSHGELCFFHGPRDTPLLARQKTFLEGWIPVVVYDWRDGDIAYDIEIFSSEHPKLGSDNTIQFARLRMGNVGARVATGRFAAAFRGTGNDNRKGTPPAFLPGTTFRMTEDALYADGQLLFAFTTGGERFAAPGLRYEKPFTAEEQLVSRRSEVGMVRYEKELAPGKSFEAVFKMPACRTKSTDEVLRADYAAHRKKTVDFWMDLFAKGTSIRIPESRVEQSYRASLVHLLLATRSQGGKGRRQGSGLPYDALFLNDYIDMRLAYDTAGLHEYVAPNVDWLMAKQIETGMFMDIHSRGNKEIVTSHGQALYSLAHHFVMTGDKAYAEKVYPHVQKGVGFILRDHKSDKYGLLRPSIPYDAPMVTGYHTCHNLFSLLALRSAIRMAKRLGKAKDVEAWSRAEKTYKEAILKAIDTTFKKDGYIGPGLYEWTAGRVQGNKGPNTYCGQDWENNLLVYPTELLEPSDRRVAVTLETIRRRKYREGCMTYRNGMHIHQYVTLNQANQYLLCGDQEHALLDLYHVLLHNGSTHEGFENLVVPWTRTVSPGCPPPHAWAAAKIALFIRNMMIVEHGGELGLREDERDLYLFSLISPAWVKPGQKLEIKNACTEMGPVSSCLEFTERGARISIDADFHRKPRHFVFRIPYFVDLKSCKADQGEVEQNDGTLRFSPDTKSVTLEWTLKPETHKSTYQELLSAYRSEYPHLGVTAEADYTPEKAGKSFLLDDEKNHASTPLSFSLVRKAFAKEYARRCQALDAKGGTLVPVKAPAMLSPVERKAYFEKERKRK